MREPRLHLTDSELFRSLMHWAPGGPYTVRGLAGAAHVSKSKVSDLCQGRPRPFVTEAAADKIASALGVDTRVLFRPDSSASTDADTRGETPHGSR